MVTFAALVVGFMVLTAIAFPITEAEEARHRVLAADAIGPGWLRSH